MRGDVGDGEDGAGRVALIVERQRVRADQDPDRLALALEVRADDRRRDATPGAQVGERGNAELVERPAVCGKRRHRQPLGVGDRAADERRLGETEQLSGRAVAVDDDPVGIADQHGTADSVGMTLDQPVLRDRPVWWLAHVTVAPLPSEKCERRESPDRRQAKASHPL